MTKVKGQEIPYVGTIARCMELFCYMAAAFMILPIFLSSEWSLYTSLGAILSCILMGRAFHTLWKIDFPQDAQVFYLRLVVSICIVMLLIAVFGIYGILSTHAGIPINTAISIYVVCAVALNISIHMALKGGET